LGYRRLIHLSIINPSPAYYGGVILCFIVDIDYKFDIVSLLDAVSLEADEDFQAERHKALRKEPPV
jgi:hypothetical protein